MSARAWRRRPDRRLVRRIAVAVLGVVLVAAVMSALLWFAPFLRVSKVDYRTEASRMAALEQAAPVAKGQPLIEVDTDRLERGVRGVRLFGDVRVSRSWPSTVVVEASPRTPVVAVRGPGEGGVHLVDGAGVDFETVPTAPDGVPVASVVAPDDGGTQRSLAVVVTSLSPDLATSMKNFAVDARGQITMTIDGVDVTWGGAQDSRLKTAVVRDLVTRAGVARIDVSAPMAPVTAAQRATPSATSASEGAQKVQPGAGASRSPSGSTATTSTTGGAGGQSSPRVQTSDSRRPSPRSSEPSLTPPPSTTRRQ